MKRINLTGNKNGKLTVIGYSHSYIQPSGQKRAIWDAVCDCGNEIKISTSNFRTGKTISCGCYRKEMIKAGANLKEKGISSFNNKYNSYRLRAINHKRKLVFALTKEQFKEIILKPCHYCGVENSSVHKPKPTMNGAFISNGIDRLDSRIGYVLENCVPCCTICNMMKNKLLYDDFINQIKRIHNHVEKGN